LFHILYDDLYALYLSAIQVAFTTKNKFGKEERELQWVQAQRTLHGLHPVQKESQGFDHHDSEHHPASNIAEQAKRRAEIARYAFIVASIFGVANFNLQIHKLCPIYPITFASEQLCVDLSAFCKNFPTNSKASCHSSLEHNIH